MSKLDRGRRALRHRFVHLSMNQHPAHGNGAVAHSLGAGDEIWRGAESLCGKGRSQPSEACDHLVEDQQDAVLAGDLAQSLEMAFGEREALHRIGEDVSERLDIVPAQFRLLVVRRPKYAWRACETMVQAPAPGRLIEGGLPTEATVAQVLVAKYADHLPLYRQAQIYARQGLDLDRSTLADWVGRAASCCGRCMSGCSRG
jgi:hypothetical protein